LSHYLSGQSPSAAAEKISEGPNAAVEFPNLVKDHPNQKDSSQNVTARGTQFRMAPGDSGVSGPGKVTKYSAEVEKGKVDFRVSLNKPGSVDQMCYPRQTGDFVSCFMYRRAIINEQRWREGAPEFQRLKSDRAYLINHEVGHGLGKGHWYCSEYGSAGRLMMQQTYMTSDTCSDQKFAAPNASRFLTKCSLKTRME
jgi:hypothetical protein